jgi:hypothetical protein
MDLALVTIPARAVARARVTRPVAPGMRRIVMHFDDVVIRHSEQGNKKSILLPVVLFVHELSRVGQAIAKAIVYDDREVQRLADREVQRS